MNLVEDIKPETLIACVSGFYLQKRGVSDMITGKC